MSPRAPHRFYYSGRVAGGPGAVIEVARDESRHMLKVLRLRAGARVDLFDAEGRAFAAELMEGERGIARLQILAPLEPEGDTQAPSGPRLNLAVAIIKRRGMELMIEKLSELGVDSLQPLITRRTVAAGGVEEKADPPERWERLALAAAKQCGRNRPLTILPAFSVEDWLNHQTVPEHRCGAYADFREGALPLRRWLDEFAREPEDATPNARTLSIAIGPEGGWTPAESQAFLSADFQPVTMGPLVLRAETAAIAAAAAVLLY